MKHYELFDYFEARYGGLLAQQIVDEMPPAGLQDLLSPEEIVKFYQQRVYGEWVAYRTCRSLRDKNARHGTDRNGAHRLRRALRRCREARSLRPAAGV